MIVGNKNMSLILLLLCIILLAGFNAEALSYDHSFSIECLEHPHEPQYNGGIIRNPELNNGLQGWTPYGSSKLQHRESSGNKYVVAHSRNQPYDSVSQKIFLQKKNHYTLSAWVQVSEGNVPVTAVVKTSKGLQFAGATMAKPNCWSMLKGGLTAYTSELADLYFESNDTSVEIWIDSISLQPFTEKQWRSHQVHNIKKARKRRVSLQIMDEQGKPLPNANISLIQRRSHFPIGSSIDQNILTDSQYQKWFTQRFTVTTFGNEMKWYSTESTQGREDYSQADAMLRFAKQNYIHVRGHNIFWDDPNYQPSWVPSLSPQQLNIAVERRLRSLVSRYKGQVIAWDVVNENMHFSFFETKLGLNFSARVFNEVHNIDRFPLLFLNEFNTIEDSRDGASNPTKYVQKLREIQSYPGNAGMRIGIGLEAHFPNSPPNLPYMRAAIDTLAATGSPIWITEIDVADQPNQVGYFEQVLREAHSHPQVNGIVMWTGRTAQGCYRLCLTDANFRNLPAGTMVDNLLREWGLGKSLSALTDQNGFLEASLFHGDYQVQINHPLYKNHTLTTHNLKVVPIDHSMKSKTKQVVKLSI